MVEVAVQVVRLEEFAEIAREARCWFAIEMLSRRKAHIVLQAEGPDGDGGYVFYREVRYVGLDLPRLIRSYEERYGVAFDGDFWLTVLDLAREMLKDLMSKLEVMGVRTREGRYFRVLSPIA